MIIESLLSCILFGGGGGGEWVGGEGSGGAKLCLREEERGREKAAREILHIHIHSCSTSLIVMLYALPRGAKITANVDCSRCSSALLITHDK